jgi:hypothetical protein
MMSGRRECEADMGARMEVVVVRSLAARCDLAQANFLTDFGARTSAMADELE